MTKEEEVLGVILTIGKLIEACRECGHSITVGRLVNILSRYLEGLV